MAGTLRKPVLVASLLALSLARVSPADAPGSPAASLFGSMAKGAAGAIGQQLAGYGLSAIGLGNSKGQLTEISDQLSEILGQLSSIATEQVAIADDITTQTCALALSNAALTDALATIATVNDQYQLLLSNRRARPTWQYPGPNDPPLAGLIDTPAVVGLNGVMDVAAGEILYALMDNGTSASVARSHRTDGVVLRISLGDGAVFATANDHLL